MAVSSLLALALITTNSHNIMYGSLYGLSTVLCNDNAFLQCLIIEASMLFQVRHAGGSDYEHYSIVQVYIICAGIYYIAAPLIVICIYMWFRSLYYNYLQLLGVTGGTFGMPVSFEVFDCLSDQYTTL